MTDRSFVMCKRCLTQTDGDVSTLEYCPKCGQTFDAPINTRKPDDGTAGHSKGEWHYYGDIICGIGTECQHPIPMTDENMYAWTSHKHEADELLPWMDEQIFDDLADKFDITWDQYRANLRLMALARTAPHDCGDPECPGVINKRKLELYDKFQHAIHAFNEQGLLT